MEVKQVAKLMQHEELNITVPERSRDEPKHKDSVNVRCKRGWSPPVFNVRDSLFASTCLFVTRGFLSPRKGVVVLRQPKPCNCESIMVCGLQFTRTVMFVEMPENWWVVLVDHLSDMDCDWNVFNFPASRFNPANMMAVGMQ